MFVKAIRTRRFIPPKDDLFSLIKQSFLNIDLKEKSIIVITSKIVSIWQGQCVKMNSVKNKDNLIKKEADLYLDENREPKGYVTLTIKNNILIPNAGIDESNGNGYFILWPKEPFLLAKQIYDFIKKNYCLNNFGIIISDSCCTPLRRGTSAVSIAYYGFYPLKDYRGTKDIFKRGMKISQSNIADALAAAAVIVMGEGDEQTPIAVIQDVDFVKFKEFDSTDYNPLKIDRGDDIYAPLLEAVKWKKRKNGRQGGA